MWFQAPTNRFLMCIRPFLTVQTPELFVLLTSNPRDSQGLWNELGDGQYSENSIQSLNLSYSETIYKVRNTRKLEFHWTI